MTTPEAKAAEEFYAPNCGGISNEKCDMHLGCHECLERHIPRANAAYYLPLLRDVLNELNAGIINKWLRTEVDAEISRLEVGGK